MNAARNCNYYRGLIWHPLPVPDLQVPDQAGSPLPGAQSGEQQEVQRWTVREPQVRYAGQHPPVRDNKTQVLPRPF